MSIDSAEREAALWGYTVHEFEPCTDGEIMVDVQGYGELIELYFCPSATGYLAFRLAFVHASHGGGDRIRTWTQARALLASISKAATS